MVCQCKILSLHLRLFWPRVSRPDLCIRLHNICIDRYPDLPLPLNLSRQPPSNSLASTLVTVGRKVVAALGTVGRHGRILEEAWPGLWHNTESNSRDEQSGTKKKHKISMLLEMALIVQAGAGAGKIWKGIFDSELLHECHAKVPWGDEFLGYALWICHCVVSHSSMLIERRWYRLGAGDTSGSL
jgi:hypothetical protein